MTSTPIDGEEQLINDIVGAATDIIRQQGDFVAVSIWQLFDELSEDYGEVFRATPEIERVLAVAQQLWADPHMVQVDQGFVEFAWTEHWCPECGEPLPSDTGTAL